MIPAATWSIERYIDAAKAATSSSTVRLSDEEVERVASLAHLDYRRGTPEFVKIQEDMQSILSTLRSLQSAKGTDANANGSPPTMASTGALFAVDAVGALRTADLRRDVVGKCPTREEITSQATSAAQGLFIVPSSSSST